MAQASFLAKKYDHALEWIEKVSALADELGYDGFLAIEGRNAVPLLRYGASKRVGEDRFFRIIRKVVEYRNDHRETATTDVSVSPSVPSRPDIEAYALGETRVEGFRQIDSAEWTSNMAKEMFFYMLCNAAGQTKEQITTELWPEMSPGKARSNFHINVYRIRRAIFPGIFLLEHGQYRLDPDLEIRFDVAEFERLLNQAERLPPDSEVRIPTLEQAVGMYRGPFMQGFYSEWVETRRRDLENKYIRSLSLLATLYGDSAKYGAAIVVLEKLIAIDPYQDEVYSWLVEYYLATGDRVSASRTYGRYLDTVVGELGASPSPRIRDLRHRILTDLEQR